MLRYAARISGLTELLFTKLDVLCGLKRVRLCTAYAAGGKTYHDLPFVRTTLEKYDLVYKEFTGGREDLSGTHQQVDLPAAPRAYLRAISRLANVPVRLVSVGSEREQVVKTGD